MGSIDKHRVPGSIDKHLPDFRGQSVLTESASYNFGDAQDQFDPIDSIDDSDNTSVLDYDPGAYSTTYDLYRIKIFVAGHGSDANGNLSIRLNNDSTANYRWIKMDAAGNIAETTGATSFNDTTFQRNSLFYEYEVRGATPYQAQSNDKPQMSSVTGGFQDSDKFIHGRLNKSIATVNRIRIFTSFNAQARGAIYGYNYPV